MSTVQYIYMKTNTQNKIKKLTINIGTNEYDLIRNVVEKGNYLNHSDYVRDIIRADLRKREVL